jgi:hypothetical protein
MKNYVAIGGFLITLLLSTGCDPTTAVVGGAAGLITGKSLIGDADQAVANRMAQAEQIGNGLVDQGVTRLSVLTEAARQAGQDTLQKGLGEMNSQERMLFQELQNLTQEVEAGKQDAYDIGQVTAIDVSSTLDQVPLIKGATYISTIRGLSVLNWREQHVIYVIATGLGPGRADETTSVTFTVDGKPIQPTNVDLSKANRGAYTFSTASLRGDANISEITSRKAVITLIRKKRGLFEKQKVVNTPILLTFYPQKAGVVTFSYGIPQFEYRKVSRKEEPAHVTSDCGNGKCDRTEGFATTPVSNGDIADPPEGNRKVANAAIRCGEPWWDPAGCGYVYDLKAVVDPTEREVKASWRVTGVWVSMLVSYDVLEWTRVEPKQGFEQIDLVYDKVLNICLPKKVDTATLSFQLLTGRKFEAVTGVVDVPGVLKPLGRSACANGGYQYAYTVQSPQ